MDSSKLRPAAEYGFDEKNGYLIFLNREVDLPEEFNSWRELVESIPDVFENGTMRAKVADLPVIDHKKLVSREEKMVAKALVSLITTAYVWGGSPTVVDAGGKERKLSIPEKLAVPLWELSQDLGNQPIIDYNDVAIIPAKMTSPFDHEGDHEEALQHLTMRFGIPGGETSKKFFQIANCVELRLVDMFHLFPKIVSEDVDSVIDGLDKVTQLIERVRGVFPLYNKYISPEIFMTKMMPCLQGFGYDPNSPFAEGIVFDGVSAEPKKLIAPSAAQSIMFHCLDELLGVEHDAKLRVHIDATRDGMFKEQRLLLKDLREHCIKTFVLNSGNDHLKTSYEKCVKAFQQCRATHLAVVTAFIVQPLKKMFDGSVDDNPMLQHPTGQTLGKFLGAMRQDTVTLQKSVNH